MEVIKPAQLAFLTIYNPSLGQSDETLHDQVVYYYSTKFREARKASSSTSDEQDREEGNEKLRQIGLAQGMVEFARAFSDGAPVDAIDSEKSRILMRELEPGWWLLASIDLTQIQAKQKSANSKGEVEGEGMKTEYSAREVCSQALLLQHLLKAHSVFLLHHAPSLADLYVRLTRPKFCAALERFWNRFVKDWDVLLHGAPAVDIFSGVKLAAGGELGIGVGEEEWGSGEREVLEGFVHRTDGLIDLVVSRFGDVGPGLQSKEKPNSRNDLWLGSGCTAGSADGVIFSGVHRLTRHSTSSVAKWVEWIFRHGPAAYGVQDNPHAPKRKRRRKQVHTELGEGQGIDSEGNKARDVRGVQNTEQLPPGIPPPIVTAATRSLDNTLARVEREQNSSTLDPNSTDSTAGTDILMKYMTFGLYGSGWGLPSSKPSTKSERDTQAKDKRTGKELHSNESENVFAKDSPLLDQRYLDGCFLIGLKGDLNDEGETDGEERTDSGDQEPSNMPKAWNSRILVRTLHVERRRQSTEDDGTKLGEDTEPPVAEFYDRVQVVVYVRQPFVFTFLFELQTPTLNYTSFYRSIHHQLGPLQRPLLRSTSPTNVLSRLYDTVSPHTVTPVDSKQPIYDLIYDPLNLTIHTTIPPIPEIGDVTLDKNDNILWSRLDALNVHSQVVSTFTETRRQMSELERTAKTNRGWWVVWIRLPSGQAGLYREAFLVRKATDYVDQNARKSSFGFGKESSGWGSGAGKLAEGIGIDARKYVEGLLSLNR